MGTNKHLEKWVGLVEVRQFNGVKVLGENRGAHVTTLVFCSGKESYDLIVENALTENGLGLVMSEDVETCEERLRNFDACDEFKKAMDQVSKYNPVVFMDFHTFPLDEM